MANRRTGKIARLPFELRTVVNTMLRDGKPYGEIIAWLVSNGITEPGEVNDQNLTNWREGGHQDWLAEQARLEEMQAKREFALQIVQQNEGSKIHEAALQIAASQVYEVLTEFDLSSLKDLLAEKPENYAQIINGLAKLSKGGLEFEKYREQVAQRKEAIAKQLDAARSKGGLQPETLDAIERELKLL